VGPCTLEKNIEIANLIREHQAGVWRYLRFLGCSPDQADDLSQATFLAFLQREPFEQFSRAATAAYLRRTAKNFFLKSVRKTVPERDWIQGEEAEEIWGDFARDDEGRSSLQALVQCLELLDGRLRKALDLRYREFRSRKELASALEMSQDGVKSLLQRAKEILKVCVEKRLRA